MNIFLTITFIFFIGSVLGWGLEVFFRRFFSSANPERKWINPGFLVGPYLPLYGACLCVLYLLASVEKFLPPVSPAINKILLLLLMTVCVTALEYLAGFAGLKIARVRLWDYTGQWGNIQGLVCPKFSLAWAMLSAVYYFFIHPYILGALMWLSENLAFSFCIGFFFGVFAIDLAYSTKVMVVIHKFADEKQIVVKYETLKAGIRASKEKEKEKARFILAMYSKTPFAEHLKNYFDTEKKKLSQRLPIKKKQKI